MAKRTNKPRDLNSLAAAVVGETTGGADVQWHHYVPTDHYQVVPRVEPTEDDLLKLQELRGARTEV